MRLRSSLFLLCLAAAAPLLALALAAIVYVSERENAVFMNAALARNRATLEGVDAELRGTVNTLRALASSRALDRDVGEFLVEAREVLATQAHWQNVVLTAPDGKQVMNARAGPGWQLPQSTIETRAFREALAGRPGVTDVIFAPTLNGEPGIAVRVPVQRDGQVKAVLTAVLKLAVFQQALESQRLPQGWVSGLVGTDGRLIARVPMLAPGSPAAAEYMKQVASASEGWYRGKTIEGADTRIAYSRSPMTGWTIGYAIPAAAMTGASAGAVALFGAGVLLSVLCATAIGLWLSRRIARPIAEIAAAAPALRTGRAPPVTGSAIEEVAALARALSEAAASIQQRDGELVRRGEELAAHAEELRQVDANRSRFLALISHELRGPLAPLRNGLAVLAATRDPAKQADARTMMERQLSMLTRLVNDLVDLGRVSRGDLDLVLQPVALDEVVQASVEMVRPQIQEKRQSLVVRHAPQPLVVLGDSDRLCQVVSNLLGNACRYTPPGGHIEVSLSSQDGQALLDVTDDGQGFNRSDAARMFDMFVRLPQQGAPAPGSLGIGLSVTRAIVEMHGGHVEASSEGPGRGATFRVRLPVASAHGAPAAPVPSRAPA